MSIPRHIWQIWLGGQIPAREAQWCAEMKRMNPTWQHHLLGNEVLERFANDPYLKALISQDKPKAFWCDRIRVLLLREEGGVYLDSDCQPIRPLDTLSAIWDSPTIEFAFGLRSPYRGGVALHRGISLADNTFIGSAPNSRMIRRIEALWSPTRVVIDGHATGCEVLANLNGVTDALLGYRYFYDLQQTPDTVVLHDLHNLASWVEDTKNAQRARFANA